MIRALLKRKLVKLSRDLKCLLDIYLDDISERDNDYLSMESLHKPKKSGNCSYIPQLCDLLTILIFELALNSLSATAMYMPMLLLFFVSYNVKYDLYSHR